MEYHLKIRTLSKKNTDVRNMIYSHIYRGYTIIRKEKQSIEFRERYAVRYNLLAPYITLKIDDKDGSHTDLSFVFETKFNIAVLCVMFVFMMLSAAISVKSLAFVVPFLSVLYFFVVRVSFYSVCDNIVNDIKCCLLKNNVEITEGNG